MVSRARRRHSLKRKRRARPISLTLMPRDGFIMEQQRAERTRRRGAGRGAYPGGSGGGGGGSGGVVELGGMGMAGMAGLLAHTAAAAGAEVEAIDAELLMQQMREQMRHERSRQ